MKKSIRISSIAGSVLVIFTLSRADVKIYFDRDNSTYNWLTSIDYTFKGPGHSFRSYFDGQSNLIKTDFNRWQENATTGFDSELSIRQRLALIVEGDYIVNGLDKRRVKTSELAAGFSVHPARYLELRPVLMASSKQRSELEGQLDEKGFGYGLKGELSPSRFRDIAVDGFLSYNRVNLSNIPWEEGLGALNASTRLWLVDTLSVALKGTESSKKYYSAAGKTEEIIRQIKQEREAVFTADMPLVERFRFRIDGGAHLSRYLYRQNQASQGSLPQRDNYGRDGNYELSIYGDVADFAHLSAQYLWSSSSQDFQGIELDQDTEKGELSFHAAAGLSSRDSLNADITFGVTSYTNPNAGAATDDRDQKTILVNGGLSHRVSRYFLIGVRGGANSFHQIYVSGARSANNGKNDTYILTPYMTWDLSERIEIKQSFDIQANYITFDFDRKKVATKNRIFRRATSRTEISLEASERLRIVEAYQYRYEDYGLLIWDDGWQQAVSWDRRRNGLETRINYTPSAIIRVSPYLFWEKTGDFYRTVDPYSDLQNPTEIRYLRDEQVKMYFELETAFLWGQNRRFVANLSHRLRKFQDRPRETNRYIKISMEYFF